MLLFSGRDEFETELFVTIETRTKLDRLSFAKTFGTVPGDRGKNWPTADRGVPSNYPRSLNWVQFPSRF